MRRPSVLIRLVAVLAYMFVMTAMHGPASLDPADPPAIIVPADPA